MSILGLQRRRHNARIEIGGELENGRLNGRAWNFRSYQNAIAWHLQRLEESDTGRIVISALRRSVLIVPRTTQDGNAVARPVSSTAPGIRMTDAPISTHFDERDGAMDGVAWSPNGANALRNTIVGILSRGTGRGSEVVIEFTPGFYVRGNPLARRTGMAGRATEILLHELVHAMMYSRGLNDPRILAGAAGRTYENRAEFNAILVTNIYRSERSRTAALRASHSLTRFDRMTDIPNFYTRHQVHVAEFCRKVPQVAQDLAAIGGAWFNPCRDHLGAGRAAA